MPMWWNSSQNTTLNETEEDFMTAQYWERVRREQAEAEEAQAQYERLLAEGYYDQ